VSAPTPRATRLLGAAALALTLGSAAFGFRTYNQTRWPGATADYRISSASFPTGSDQLREAEESFEAWNRIPNSEFLFTYASASNSGALNHSDGVNGVAFSSQVQGSTLGVTFTSDSRGQRRAADVLFNNRTRWSFDGTPSRSEFDFGSTCRHEYGHALGLRHSDLGCRALMGGGCGRQGVVRPFAQDDLNGIRFLYPGPSRHSGTPGTPTIPTTPAGPTQDWELSGLQLSQTTVAPGDALQVGYTVVQRGPGSPASAPPRAYLLSTNQTLSAQDTVLLQTGARQGPFATGANFQGQSPITIPAGTAPGTYWLGVLVDPQGSVTESDERNNARAQRIEVRPAGSTGPLAQVDWVVENLVLTPAQALPGELVEVAFEVRNAGPETAAQSPVVGIYLSANATITTRDQELQAASSRQGPFATGQGVPLKFSLRIPAGTQPGALFLGVFADPNDQVAEAEEGNNTDAETFQVLTPPTAPAAPAPQPAPVVGAPAPAPPLASPSSPQTVAAGSTAAPAGGGSSGGGGGGCSLDGPSFGGSGAPAWLCLLLGVGLLVLRRRV
jgi:matrixin/CARDB protein